VSPREDVSRFAAALGRVLDDPDYSAELGCRAQRRVQRMFSLEAVGQQLRAALLAETVPGSERQRRLPTGLTAVNAGQPDEP
jgi:glycosyltransferase involved in cell wall biosynthesis